MAAAPATVADLEPKPVWQFFAGIAAVPRPSKHEERIRAHVRQVAEKLGFAVREDGIGNIVIQVPAKPGCERAPVTVLQGHLDMVCEKNAGTAHDFDKEGIHLLLEKDPKTGEPIVRGKGTTLGADNGIGVAMALAAASSPDVRHGPLEILCTVDEEMGMSGAAALEPGFFQGKRMINLDSEEDNVIYIGCAGGGDSTLTWDFETQPVEKLEICRVTISGLRGGHSGGDIHENRGNANRILARVLAEGGADLRLSEITGGSKRNAIPREAQAVIAGPAGVGEKLRAAAKAVRELAARESAEPELKISVEAAEAQRALTVDDTRCVLLALTALPHGVLEMVPQIPGLVQTSSNVATINTSALGASGLRVEIGNLSRSSVDTRIDAVWAQIAAVAQLAGARFESGNRYPGWQPNVDSQLLAICRDTYRGLFNKEPNVTAIHAGLECGIIGRRMGGLDMVSFGPNIKGAHSPDERTYPRSVEKSYKMLCAVLGDLAKA